MALGVALVAALNVTDRRVYTVALPSSRTLTVELTIGELRVQGESRTDAQIEVVRRAPTAAGLARIPVTLDETPAEVRVTAVQTEHTTDPTIRSDVTLRVPHDAALKSLRVVEGRMVLSNLSGSVAADVRRGPIEATGLRGTVRLETGIGNVIATDMRLSPNGLIRLRAFNGDVRLLLAERPADARVLALVLNGTIQSQIPLAMKDTWGPHFGEATFGKGEPVISLDVVTGTIAIQVR